MRVKDLNGLKMLTVLCFTGQKACRTPLERICTIVLKGLLLCKVCASSPSFEIIIIKYYLIYAPKQKCTKILKETNRRILKCKLGHG